MDSVVDIAAARKLVADAALWPRVRSFLWDFVPQMHESWLEGLLRDMPDRSLVANPRVKRYILESLGIGPVFHAFPKDDFSRIALLDGKTVLDVVKWLGAIACADSLRSVTKGSEVRALKASLPGVYPEVFGFTAYFSGLDLAVDGADPVEAGAKLLCSALAGLDEALMRRIALKLPKALEGAMDGRGALASKRDDSRKAINKLLKLKFPEAYKLCC